MASTNAVGRAAERLKTAQMRLAMLALCIMMLVTVCDVTMRYLLGRPIRGAYDVVEATLVVFVFHSLSACFLGRQNIVIDLIDGMLGERATNVLIRISDIVSVCLLALIAWAMVTPARQAFEYDDTKLELGLPIWILWAFAIVGLVGALFCAIGALFEQPSRNAGGELS